MMARRQQRMKEEHEMDAKELQAWKRVAKKLSALRQTLRKDEQRILDRMIVGEASEVELHAMRPRTQPRATPRAQPRATPRAQPEASEVELHAMKPRTQPRATPRAQPRATPRTTPRLAPRWDLRLTLDASGEYSIAEEETP